MWEFELLLIFANTWYYQVFQGWGVKSYCQCIIVILIWVLEFEFRMRGKDHQHHGNSCTNGLEIIHLFTRDLDLVCYSPERGESFKAQNCRVTKISVDQDWGWSLEKWADTFPVIPEFSQVTASAFAVPSGTSNFATVFV